LTTAPLRNASYHRRYDYAKILGAFTDHIIHHSSFILTSFILLTEFNQMVDGEQWDENGSAFMAIRQTVLTTLVGSEGEDIASRMMKGGPIIVDLSDPVLQSTGLDGILFDMILCLYCVIRPDYKKFLGGLFSHKTLFILYSLDLISK
jgi:hypothetical protein